MSKRNIINYIKPDDPPFLKALKKQAGYDDKNHKFDELQNAEEDFVGDSDSEQPQIVVLKKGDLTAEEAEFEKKRLEHLESETKADLSQRIIFKSKQKSSTVSETKKRKADTKNTIEKKRNTQLLSFHNDEEEED